PTIILVSIEDEVVNEERERDLEENDEFESLVARLYELYEETGLLDEMTELANMDLLIDELEWDLLEAELEYEWLELVAEEQLNDMKIKTEENLSQLKKELNNYSATLASEFDLYIEQLLLIVDLLEMNEEEQAKEEIKKAMKTFEQLLYNLDHPDYK